MRINKKCSNTLKLIILTLLVSITLALFTTTKATSDNMHSVMPGSSSSAVGAGSLPSEMEMDVRSNSIAGVNADNPGKVPFYCMFHGRALSYRNNPSGGGTSAGASSIAQQISNTTKSTMSVSNTINNFTNMIRKMPNNQNAQQLVGRVSQAIVNDVAFSTVVDYESTEDTTIERDMIWLTWSQYVKVYEFNNQAIEPSTGYAIYYLLNVLGIDPSQEFNMDFQYVIWSSRNFGNESNVLDEGSNTAPSSPAMSSEVRARAHQYGQVYYEILQYGPDGLFSVTPDDPDVSNNSLKIMVDKTTGLYTVGPYKLKCNYGSPEAKAILYNEIIGTGNVGYVEKVRFAKYLEITNLNYEGTEVEYLRTDGTPCANGAPTSFPDFVNEEQFYIRFKPKHNGAINRLSQNETFLNPLIRIEYINQFDVEARARYESTTLEAHEVHAEFSYGKSLSTEIVNWLTVKADKSVPPECQYKIDSVSWTEVGGYEVKQHYDKEKQKVEGTTDITVKLTFTTRSGSDPHTVEVKFEGVKVYQEIKGTKHCHTNTQVTDPFGNVLDVCSKEDWINFPDPPPEDKWLFVGEDKEADDIVVDGVTLQPGLRLITGSSFKQIPDDWWRVEYTFGDHFEGEGRIEGHIHGSIHTKITEVRVGGKRINMQLGGYAWLDAGDAKTASYNNIRDTRSQEEYNNGAGDAYFRNYSYRGFWDTPNNDKNFTGMQVELYDQNQSETTPIAYTTTDKYGRYRFYGLAENPGSYNEISLVNPLHNYLIKFKFNGQLYTQVESNNDGKYAKWTAGGEGKNSSADEITGQGEYSREAVNNRFETIKSLYNGGNPKSGTDNNSYTGTEGTNKAFGMFQKLETAYGEFSNQQRLDGEAPKYVHGFGNYLNTWAYAYGDAWDDFINKATNTTNFTNPDYLDCTKTWFNGYYNSRTDVYDKVLSDGSLTGKWGYDSEYVRKFIKDCLMKAKTISPTYTIPGDYDRFVINNVNETQVKQAQLYDPELSSTAWAGFKNLYTQESDQSRYINYGIHERQRADLAVQKDVFNAKVIVDGEMETYDYRSKNMTAQASDEAYAPQNDNTTWNIYQRRADILYKLHNELGTGTKDGETAFVHPLEIRRSDYLKTWTETADLNKNLQILITYRIAVKNQGSVPVVVNELIDYYDSKEMSFDGTLNGDTYTPTEYKKYSQDGTGKETEKYKNTYISSQMNGSNEGNLTVKTTGYDGRTQRTLAGTQIDSGLTDEYKYYYDTLFLSGINGGKQLEPGQITFAYVSFKVNNPSVTRLKYSKIKDKPILDITFDDGTNLVGKRNIIEVNSYSTPKQGNDNINYGFVDIDSCAGSLDNNDLNKETGNIQISNNPLKDHQEDDTDEAPNLRIRISSNDDTRVYTGYAYEDNRNEVKDKAVVGNGEFTEGETKINGVTMQMYQLQRQVDENGIFTGRYSGNPIRLQQYRFAIKDLNNGDSIYGLEETITDPRYSTGTGEARILFDAENIPALKVDLNNDKMPKLTKNDGAYAYASIPSGDYFIRFIYGDTYDTVLTNSELGQEVKALIGQEGRNARSYNGQDYKSTVYQGLDTKKALDQSNMYYNGIYGYGYGFGGLEECYDKQNYSYVADGKYNNLDYATYKDYATLPNDDGNKRELMYYYDIKKADEGAEGLSDAKDVYYYRWKANNYGRGTKFDSNTQQTQRNHLMETLSSWEKVQTYQEGNLKERQELMIQELMNQTQMVSQTGIISTKGEYDTTVTGNPNVNNIDSATQEYSYIIRNLNLGLVERPEAQLKLTKRISNFQITLANGRVLFETDKTVRNLYMAQHKGHLTFFADKDTEGSKPKYTYWTSKGIDALRGEKENLYDKLGSQKELRRLAAVATSANSKETPELLQVYMDDELLEGAMMKVQYEFLVENAGEVDYLDKQFYYTGKTAHADDTGYVSRTNPYTVVDYVSNMIRYDQQYQESKNDKPIVWTAKNLNELISSAQVDRSGKVTISEDVGGTVQDGNVSVNTQGNYRKDLVNRKYANKVKTYNQILTTDSLRNNTVETALLPVKYFKNSGEAKTEGNGIHTTKLVLATELSTNNTGDNLVYNNLAELVETQNSVGRRMQFSIVGNQSMSDQSLRNDSGIDEDTSEDLVTPKEIDSDSAQKIVITKPTGEFRNYTPWIITAIAAFAIIAISAVVISVKVLGNKNK